MNSENMNQGKGPSISSVQLTGVNLRQEEDPRIKSPDEILTRFSQKKTALDIPHKTEAPKVEAPKSDDRVAELNHQLADARARYDQEVAQWRDYERRIQEWRAQVISIVEGLRRDASAQQATLKELERCRTALQNQERELQALRAEKNRLKVVG